MNEKHKKQLKAYWILVLIDAIAAGITVLSPLPSGMAAIPASTISKPVLVVANFALVFVVYGLLGLLGLFLTGKNGWPGIYKDGEGWKNLFLRPLFWGVISGLFLIVGSNFFEMFHNLGKLPHPPFPFSISASFAAGIGEELIMRLLLMSFWAWILSLVFKKYLKKNITDWIAVIVAALVFGISHLAAPMYLMGFNSPGQLPIIFIIELLVLNGVIGILAGRNMIKYGFVAAVGIHFWTDIVWHAIYGAF